MAQPSLKIIDALRKTADALEESKDYQWGHMGLCNCGFLAQHITHLQKREIHQKAMERYGDWNQQLNDYCSTSGLAMDDLISEMIAFGFDASDLKHLEKLSDPGVLHILPLDERTLRHNLKHDVIHYFRTWASKLEIDLLNSISLPTLRFSREVQV